MNDVYYRVCLSHNLFLVMWQLTMLISLAMALYLFSGRFHIYLSIFGSLSLLSLANEASIREVEAIKEQLKQAKPLAVCYDTLSLTHSD
jgi:hypothetical protein